MQWWHLIGGNLWSTPTISINNVNVLPMDASKWKWGIQMCEADLQWAFAPHTLLFEPYWTIVLIFIFQNKIVICWLLGCCAISQIKILKKKNSMKDWHQLLYVRHCTSQHPHRLDLQQPKINHFHLQTFASLATKIVLLCNNLQWRFLLVWKHCVHQIQLFYCLTIFQATACKKQCQLFLHGNIKMILKDTINF